VQVGKPSITTNISSKLIKQTLQLMQDEGYLASVEEQVDSKGNYLVITLNGKLNKCGVIKPRFTVQVDNLEKYEKQHLPARGFGVLIVTTNQGLLTHNQAKEKHVGGRLISYCY
jgi:small subunit ribosomal protein S8